MGGRGTFPVECPGINVAVLRRQGSGWEVLLLQRGDDETYPRTWGLLTGTRRRDETAAELAARELAEETGLTAESLWATEHVIHFYEPTVDRIWVLPVVAAVVDSGGRVRLSGENRAFLWLSFEQGRRRVSWRNLVEVLRCLEDETAAFPHPTWVRLPARGNP